MTVVGQSVALYDAEQERAILATLGLDPVLPETQALMAAAREYELDPLLQEIILIPNRGKFTVYITRDGCLAIAHRHPQFDGIVTDEMRRNSTGDGWTVFVSVWRKDMGHPFRYGAQCKDTERQAKEGYGLEQALARAERRALKRAFHLRGEAFKEVRTVLDVGADTVEPTLLRVENVAADPGPGEDGGADSGEVSAPPSHQDQTAAHRAIAELDDDARAAWLEGWGIEDFSEAWPTDAVNDALTMPFAGTS